MQVDIITKTWYNKKVVWNRRIKISQEIKIINKALNLRKKYFRIKF